jgi:hypothetical protein
MINCDRLAAWWEAEAQDYLEHHSLGNFKDRQVRAWGDTNSQFWRYHESVVGDHPEFSALETQLKKTLRKAWSQLPSWRIVEDVMRYPLAIDKRVEYKGGVVPDFCIQHTMAAVSVSVSLQIRLGRW